ncbi:MAG TPA: glycosyltransferase [Cytophagales bacterium]|nr:glycosyltransferase [Cytophagales bacterium]
MKVEIIIPTKDRYEDLKKAIKSIVEQTLLPSKIVIVDAGEIPKDYSVLLKLCADKGIYFKVIPSAPGLTHQRNQAIGQIEHDLVIFFDDDVELDSNYIKSIASAFEADKNMKLGGATGKILNAVSKPGLISKLLRKTFLLSLPSKGEILPSGCVNMIDYSKEDSFEINWLSGCNMAYRKEVFERFLFDENLKIYASEDFDFSFRVNKKYKLIYVPSARLLHNHSPASRLSKAIRTGMFVRGHNYLFKKNMPQTFYNKVCHFWSLNGILIQKLLLEKSMSSFIAALEGYIEILFQKNYTMPNPKEVDPKFK